MRNFSRLILPLSLIFTLGAQALETVGVPADHFVENAVGTTLAKDFLFFSQPSARDAFLDYVRARGFENAAPVKILAPVPVGQSYQVQVLKQKITFQIGLDKNQIKIGDNEIELSARLGNLSEKMKDDFDLIRIALAVKVDRPTGRKFRFLPSFPIITLRRPASINSFSTHPTNTPGTTDTGSGAKANANGLPLSALDIAIADAAVAIEQTTILYLSQWAYREQVWEQLCDGGNNLAFDWNWQNETYVRSKIALVDEQISRPYFYGLTTLNANAILAEQGKAKCEDEALNDQCALIRQKLACYERILNEPPKVSGKADTRLPEDQNFQVRRAGAGSPWSFTYDNFSLSRILGSQQPGSTHL